MTDIVPIALLKGLSLATVLLFMVSVGLAAAPDRLTYLWRRPGLLFRSVLAVFVCVPVLTVVLVAGLNLPRAARIAMVLMALSPAGPFSLRRSREAGGEVEFARSLHLALCLCAPVTIPLSLAGLGMLFPVRAGIPSGVVLGQVLVPQLIPLALGICVGRARPGLAARIARPVEKIALALLMALTVAVLAETWRLVFSVGWGTAAALVLMAALSLAVGHLFGGPSPGTRTALAIAGAARHPGIALLAAAVYFPRQGVGAVVLAELLVVALAITPYQLRRRSSAGEGASGGTGESGRAPLERGAASSVRTMEGGDE